MIFTGHESARFLRYRKIGRKRYFLATKWKILHTILMNQFIVERSDRYESADVGWSQKKEEYRQSGIYGADHDVDQYF